MAQIVGLRQTRTGRRRREMKLVPAGSMEYRHHELPSMSKLAVLYDLEPGASIVPPRAQGLGDAAEVMPLNAALHVALVGARYWSRVSLSQTVECTYDVHASSYTVYEADRLRSLSITALSAFTS